VERGGRRDRARGQHAHCTQWLARFASEGVAGLQNRNSAPHLVTNKLPAPGIAMVIGCVPTTG
jgi:hypothetical protein